MKQENNTLTFCLVSSGGISYYIITLMLHIFVMRHYMYMYMCCVCVLDRAGVLTVPTHRGCNMILEVVCSPGE